MAGILCCDPVHQFADALAVLRQLVGKTRELRVRPQPDDIQQRQRERTHHEAGQLRGKRIRISRATNGSRMKAMISGDQRGDEEHDARGTEWR